MVAGTADSKDLKISVTSMQSIGHMLLTNTINADTLPPSG